MFIINLTQHPATDEQKDAGVLDFEGEKLEILKDALNFDDIPHTDDIQDRAYYIAELAASVNSECPPFAMIGGALWLMAPLARELRERGIAPLFAFTKRCAVEKTESDGSVTKTAVFKHAGWVEAV